MDRIDWRLGAQAAVVGLLLAIVAFYALGCIAVGLSMAFRCDDQCQADRVYGVQR